MKEIVDSLFLCVIWSYFELWSAPWTSLNVAEPEKRDPAMRTHVYHLKVHFVSTASMGKEEPEVTKEKGLHMIEIREGSWEDWPAWRGASHIEWVVDNSENGEVSESFLMRLSEKDVRNTSHLWGCILTLGRVGNAILEVAADR